MRVATVCASTGLILVAAAATACSGSSSPGAAAPAGKTAAAATGSQSTGTAGSAASASGKNVDVCTALPAATISQITGTKFTTAKPSNVEGVIFDCEYGGHLTEMNVSVAMQNGPGDFSADTSSLQAVGHAPNKVTGVGDEAFAAPDPKGSAGSAGAASFASFGAVFGDTYIKISGLNYVTPAQGTQIAEELHGKL